MKTGKKIRTSVTVTNTGDKDGKEVVQLYIRDQVCRSTRTLKELKGFQKIALKAGESKTVSFDIPLFILSSQCLAAQLKTFLKLYNSFLCK